MGKVTSGVFPVHANDFEVMTGPDTWVKVAELEEVNMTIDNTTETWTTFASGGWDSALVTGKSAKIEFKGKRCIGDAGNDFIANKMMETGENAYIPARILRPDGKTITWEKMACAVDNDGSSGKATAVGALEGTLTGHGKPTLTDTASTSSVG